MRFRWIPILAVMVLLASCGGPRSQRKTPSDPSMSADQLTEAQADLDRLRELLLDGDSVEAAALAARMLEDYPGFGATAELLVLGAQASDRSGEPMQAEAWVDRLLEEYPQSPERPRALALKADLTREREAFEEEAWALLELRTTVDDPPVQIEIEDRLDPLLRSRLRLDELDALADRIDDETALADLRFTAGQRSLEGAREPATVTADRLVLFLREHPDDERGDRFRAALATLAETEGIVVPSDIEIVLANRIGILCPLTGENASLGQAMYDGALLALEEHNRIHGTDLRLVSMDTRGDGVRAVQASKQLIENDGVLAIVGALLSTTTIPVATLCAERGVPLVSPTATQETISDLGAGVFQTNLTKSLETRLVAQVAVDRLHRRRFAILYPASEEGELAAEQFRREVERRGGRVEAAFPLERGMTDYGPILSSLKLAGPEALFVPVTPSEMRLIAPQLIFHGIETQLLGPSSWNNSTLREVSESLDRALFPSDIAQIPEGERARFEELWERRFRGQASNPFALKTYFAVRLVLTGIEEGNVTRQALTVYLERELTLGVAGTGLGLEKLRMLVDGRAEPFPVEMFPQPEATYFWPGLSGSYE